MAGRQSKNKGSTFERYVCRTLSLWITAGQRQDCFWRSAMSGGRATRGRQLGHDLQRQAGDISAIAPEGHTLTDRFYVECKHVRSLDLHGLVAHRGTLLGYWREASEQASHWQRIPLLIARQDRTPIVVCTNEPGHSMLDMDPVLRLVVPLVGDRLYLALLGDLTARPCPLTTAPARRRLGTPDRDQ